MQNKYFIDDISFEYRKTVLVAKFDINKTLTDSGGEPTGTKFIASIQVDSSSNDMFDKLANGAVTHLKNGTLFYIKELNNRKHDPSEVIIKLNDTDIIHGMLIIRHK